MMLITLELQSYDEPGRSRLTLGTFCPDGIPELTHLMACYADRRATTPPGAWERMFRGQKWWVRCVPAPAFMGFLREWRHIPVVNAFLDRHTRLVCTSLSDIPGMHCSVWVHEAIAADTVVLMAETGRRRRKRRCEAMEAIGPPVTQTASLLPSLV
ncbi:TPA: hypothetical protein I8Y21_003638 [Klebsiella oxytoca]|uniref:Uncharacterized protein n=1 Tax=Klebsiella oxytoca TaxID=571 RepID=A0AAN5L9W0_KLEOX|nr:hypothetical protein [Klebsiella oxytoca]